MKPTTRIKAVHGIVLLGASAAPITGSTHWEGFEAADPTTPAAVLRLESAAGSYTAPDARPASWRALFADRDSNAVAVPARGESRRDAGAAGDDAGAAPSSRATRQQ